MTNKELMEQLVEGVEYDVEFEVEGINLEQYLDDLQGI